MQGGPQSWCVFHRAAPPTAFSKGGPSRSGPSAPHRESFTLYTVVRGGIGQELKQSRTSARVNACKARAELVDPEQARAWCSGSVRSPRDCAESGVIKARKPA